jgi:predicted DsbA family dithiol-disulfide isomerase
MEPADSLRITIFSDVICPWCFIGTRRLQGALAESGVHAAIEYRAFLLDPTIPPEGVDLRDRLRHKYGVDPETMFTRIEAAAQASGIPLDFARVRRTPDTVPAHTLLRHAHDRGTQADLADSLFAAYFLEGIDIGNSEALAERAVAHGFDREEAVALVTDPAEMHATRDEAQASARLGISGVPLFVFAQRFTVSGAQSPAVFRNAIAQAVA